jgi:hypothetical protein
MAALSDVKQLIVEALKDDSTLVGLLGSDASGQTPVYRDPVMGRMLWLPCVTVQDVYVRCEQAGLNDAYDGLKRYGWNHALIQIDVWARNPEQRDELSARIQQVLLAADFRAEGLAISPPLIFALAEPERSVYRHSMRFTAFYVAEVSV